MTDVDLDKQKFKYIMKQMFPNTNQDFTFEHFDKYINNPELDKKGGVYVVKVKNGAKISLVDDLDNPDGPKQFITKDKKTKEEIIKNLKDFNKYTTMEEFKYKLAITDDEILEIGKSNNDLKYRLTKYKKFGEQKEIAKIPHKGGRRIWFIKDNKHNLVIDYINTDTLDKKFHKICDDARKIGKNKPLAEIIEAGLIYLHFFAYGERPFANEIFGSGGTEKDWRKFWNKYKIN